MNKEIPYKIYLEENELPRQWYNVRADMKNKPAPLLNPATLKPMAFEDLRPVFCDELIRQELTIPHLTSTFPRRSWISIRCTVHHRWYGPTVWKRNWILRPTSTTNLRGIIPAAATN